MAAAQITPNTWRAEKMGVVYDYMLDEVRTDGSSGGGGSAYPVPPCSNIRCLQQGETTVRIKWDDPEDLTVDGVALAEWGSTKLLRKAGDYPAGPDDGTLVVSTTVRGQYSADAFIDTLPDTSQQYFYRLFTITTAGVVNDDASQQFMPGALTWATVADVVRSGEAADVFAVGDVLTVEHATYGEIEMEIAGFDQHTPVDAAKTHTMLLLAKNTIADLMFDAPELQYGVTADTVFNTSELLAINLKGASAVTTFKQEAAATGTARVWYSLNGQYKLYYSTSNKRWEIWSCNSGTHIASANYDYQSTAAAAPTGGVWNGGTTAVAAKAYYTFDGNEYALATVADGAAVLPDTYYEPNPNASRYSYGYNSWRESALRQWLNTDKGSGTWWQAQNIWDVAPGYANTLPGFLAGIADADFLAAIGPVKLTTARNTVCDCGGYDVTEDLVFLASRTEVFGENNNSVAEGEKLGLYATADNTDRIKYNPAGAAKYWWLRSPYPGLTFTVYVVNTTGTLHNVSAYNARAVAPACVIC